MPGPSDYQVKLDECVQNSIKQTSIPRAKRWSIKPTKTANVIDTRPAITLLKHVQPRSIFGKANRNIDPRKFNQKYDEPNEKGLY